VPVDEGARFCPSCGSPLEDARPGEEERKLVTILFADVIGSTELGEQLDPERLRSLLSAYFSAMSAVIEAWGGTVEKFIGDAVMAVFGIPIVREDDAERALRASLEMLERLGDLNRDFRERHRVTLRIRIGVNTGEVIAPVGGRPDQMIVAGDAVNVAARLEQTAEPGTVLVGERTYLTARNAFRFGDPVQLDLKGKAQAVPGYRLLGLREEGARGVPGLHTAMVGRDRELENLASVLEQSVESGRPHLVTVFGPAGIGKSRLVTEFLRLVPTRYEGATVLQGRCLAAGRGITYWPLGEILRSACGIALDDAAPVAGVKLRRGAVEVLSRLELEQVELDRTVFALATTAGIPLSENPLDAMDPRSVRDELGRAWPLFVQGHAVQGPAVLLVEDLHFAVADLLEMVEWLVARSMGPVLVVATARPEFAESHPRFAAGSEGSSSIFLRPLSEQQSAELVEGLLAAADLPSELRTEILAKAEGNPFFLEEIIRRLIDEGALVREGVMWRATPAAARTPLPDTVHALLAARIDALPLKEKRVLQEASVVGRVFWEEPVAQSIGDGAVSDSLLELERKGLVFARPSSTIAGQVEFMFKHALIRDVAYASLPKARRARAHAELGEWIEELAGDRTEEFAEIVAHHFAAAVAGEDADLAWTDDEPGRERARRKAFEALIAAGAAARRRFAVRKALDLHEQARSLVADDRERARILEEEGDDHRTLVHGDDAVAAYREAISLVRTDPSATPADLSRLCLKTVDMVEWMGAFRTFPDPAEIEPLIREGLDLAQDDLDRARFLNQLAGARLFWDRVGRPDPVALEQRIGFAEQSWEIADRLENPELAYVTNETLGKLYWTSGQYVQALEAARRILRSIEDIRSPRGKAEALNTAAESLMDTGGEYEEGLELGERSRELARGMNPHQLMHATVRIIEGLFYLGRWAEVEPVLSEHLAAFQEEADVSCNAVRGGPLLGAAVLAHMGSTDRAAEIARMIPPDDPKGPQNLVGFAGRYHVAAGEAETAVRLAERVLSSRDVIHWPDALWVIVDALAAVEDWDGLRRYLPQARERAPAIALLGPASDLAEGLMHAAEGQTEAARSLVRAALERYQVIKVPFLEAQAREALASMVSGNERRSLLEAALSLYERLGAKPHADRVREAP
jgi:class 3 adenylate cyclase/tetratricopeptide (TPR) repeat protein